MSDAKPGLVAVVTGASNGIGEAATHRLARQPARRGFAAHPPPRARGRDVPKAYR